MMFPNVNPEQQKLAMGMALLSGGAAAMDPRGTFGNAGTGINRGIQQSLQTVMPMMQFFQQSNLAKEDRDYKKKQDRFRNRMARNQQQLQQMQFAAGEENRKFMREYHNKTYGLQERKYQAELDRLKQQQEMMMQFAQGQTRGVPDESVVGVAGPRAGNDPKTSMPKGAGQPTGYRPMTQAETQFGLANLALSGAPAGAVSAIGGLANPPEIPGSQNFSMSAYKGQVIERLAKEMVTKGQAKSLDEARLQLIQKIDPMNAFYASKMADAMGRIE